MNKSTTDTPYNYKFFDSSVYGLDPFVNVAPRVGECAKDFTALGLDGKPIKLSDFKGKRIILETGSLTCPMFGGNIEGMNRLAEQFTDKNTVFLMLYVREAHPGGKIHAHRKPWAGSKREYPCRGPPYEHGNGRPGEVVFLRYRAGPGS